MHHHIVGLEAIHLPYPGFVAPSPHTCTTTSYQTTRPEELHDRVKDATIIIATTVKLNAHTLSPEITPKLQMVAIMASGTDHVDLDACRKRGITASNGPHAPTEVVSDHAISLYFAARRKTVMMHNITMANPSEWKAKGSVVGYVKDASASAPISGKRIEALAKALGMQVLIADRKDSNTSSAKDTLASRIPFADVLKRSTVLILCLPRTPDTLNLISEAELATMAPQAVIVNVSRGGIVDENAIVAALKDGAISGYATDVFAIEPAEGARDSPLLSPEASFLNLTVSPHVAWFGKRTLQNTQQTLKENIELFMGGKPQNVLV